MLRTVVLAALALAGLHSVAEARSRSLQKMQITQVGCPQPDMRPCEAGGEHRSASSKTAGKANRTAHSPPVVKDFGITHKRPRAWCGWWLGRHLGMPSRSLWRALAWRHVGRAADGPAIGAIVIWSRGKGRGHVGIITGKTVRGWMVLSGNDGNAVRERVRSVSNAIAFRWP